MSIDNMTLNDLLNGGSEIITGQLIAKFTRDRSPLFTSGLAVTSNEVAAATSGPRLGTIRHINPLDLNFNISTDDLAQQGDVFKNTASEYLACRWDLNKPVGMADLLEKVTRHSETHQIAELFAEDRAAIDNEIAMLTLRGLVTVAADDNTFYQPEQSEGYAGGVISALGARQDESQFTIAIMNKQTAARLKRESISRNSDYITSYVSQRESGLPYDVWNGYKVVTSNHFGTDIIVAREGFFAYSSGTDYNGNDIEVVREGLGGNGGGGQIVINRWSSIIHPQGFTANGGTVFETASALKNNLENGLVYNWAGDHVDDLGFCIVKAPLAADPVVEEEGEV